MSLTCFGKMRSKRVQGRIVSENICLFVERTFPEGPNVAVIAEDRRRI